MIDVSIIIVNYNTQKLTQACIESIINNTYNINFEIILIDNASTDGSQNFFQDFNNILFIKSDKNLGFGKANNLGYNIAKGKYIFLLNSDTIILNNAIKIFFDTMENLPNKVACAGCLLLESNKSSIATSFGEFPKFENILTELKNMYLSVFFKNKKVIQKKDFFFNTESFKVDYIIGADLFMRKNIIDELGLFDPSFFMYYEETELQYRYNKFGYESHIISGPKIIHLEPNIKTHTKKIYSTQNRYIYFEGMFIYFKKRYNFLVYLIWRILCLGYLPTIIKSKGNIFQKIKLFLLFIGIKTIKY